LRQVLLKSEFQISLPIIIMNPKPVIFSGMMAIASLLASNASSQSLKPSDQGISTHNYKHINKAAFAREAGLDGIIVPVSYVATIENSGSQNNGRLVHQTPKYAISKSSLTVQTIQQKQKVNINPLISNRNYKTINPAPAKPKDEEWVSQNI
jgi:hypothetical protein